MCFQKIAIVKLQKQFLAHRIVIVDLQYNYKAQKGKFVEEMFTLFNMLELHKGFNHDAE